MKKRISFAVFFLVILVTSCARAPEKVEAPGLKIGLSIVDNREIYTVSFTGYIENSNDDVMFLDMKGFIDLVDPSSGKTVDSFSFTIPEVFPLDMGMINARVKRDEKQVTPLLEMLRIDREKLVKEKESSPVRLEKNKIRMRNLEYRKENIIDVLRAKS